MQKELGLIKTFLTREYPSISAIINNPWITFTISIVTTREIGINVFSKIRYVKTL